MKRIVLYLVVLGALLYIVNAIAPLVVLGVMGLVLLAWKRPETIGRLADRPQMARVPASMRATPMRFAGTVGFAAFVLVGLSMPLGAIGRAVDAPPTPRPIAVATSAPTAQPTEEPTAEPTERPTRRPTPTPEPTPTFGSEPTGPTEVGTVVSVTDGDTIRVLIDGREYPVRYIGVSTPEIRNPLEWMGPEAAAANAALVEGREVILEKDVSETDRFDRLLRHVWVEDGVGLLLVNLELVRLGFAQVTTFPPDVKYIDELYVPAQREAVEDGLGLWGIAPTPQPTPAPTVAPTPVPTAVPAAAPVAPLPLVTNNCEPSYPGICIPIGSADIDCGEIAARRFAVVWNVPNPDPHGFDGDGDGIGCES